MHHDRIATDERTDLADRLGRDVVARSPRRSGALALWAEREGPGRYRLAAAATDPAALAAFEGDAARSGDVVTVRMAPSPRNLAALRATLANLAPQPLGLATSAGFGDRLGLATPGHVDAIRASRTEGRVAPIFAQQSMRENARTGRTPLQVLDDATAGAFVAGWRGAVGADADHLKREDEIDRCLDAGYSFFTFDPGEHVVAGADALSGRDLEDAFERVPPWAALGSDTADTRLRLRARRVELGDRELRFDDETLSRAAVKYGGAVAHVARLSRHLRLRSDPSHTEIEVSVDEAATPTTPLEHAYLALELRRLGVDWVSLAPRFVGDFEKGVDYRGDLGALAGDLALHADVARALGPYKLSLHSGSDKFAVYPLAAEACSGALHLKTAGTSYLEALRVAGAVDPELLGSIARLGLERFGEDVTSYHVSGRPDGVPDLDALAGAAIVALLEQRDARQVLHVTFGSALALHGERLRELLLAHDGDYRDALRRHFERHLAPLSHRSEA